MRKSTTVTLILTVTVIAVGSAVMMFGQEVLGQDSTALERRAENGDPDGQFLLGLSYHSGLGRRQDDAAALSWFRKSAAQENAIAKYWIGKAYADGRGVAKDTSQAVGWYRQAAAGPCRSQADVRQRAVNS
jgi:TPR repeat protein